MMTLEEALTYVGQQVRSCHPYAFRSKQWATIVSAAVGVNGDRIVWALIWPDGITDVWPVVDELAEYEFRSGPEDPTLTRALAVLKSITLAIKADVETPGIRAPRELRDQLVGILIDWSEAEENA